MVAQTRGGAVWQLVGLITQRSEVQILLPQPYSKASSPKLAFPFYLFLCNSEPASRPQRPALAANQAIDGRLEPNSAGGALFFGNGASGASLFPSIKRNAAACSA